MDPAKKKRILALALANIPDPDTNLKKPQRYLRKQPGALTPILHIGEKEKPEIAELRRRIINKPQNSDLHNNLGVHLLSEHRFKEAENALRKGIRLSPKDSDLWNNLGIVLYELDNKKEAESAFKRAIKLSPDTPNYRISLANILSSKKDFDGSIQILSEFLGGDFDDPAVRINLALNFKAKGLLGLAIDQLEQAMELTVGAKEEDLINMQKHAKELMKELKKLRKRA